MKVDEAQKEEEIGYDGPPPLTRFDDEDREKVKINGKDDQIEERKIINEDNLPQGKGGNLQKRKYREDSSEEEENKELTKGKVGSTHQEENISLDNMESQWEETKGKRKVLRVDFRCLGIFVYMLRGCHVKRYHVNMSRVVWRH